MYAAASILQLGSLISLIDGLGTISIDSGYSPDTFSKNDYSFTQVSLFAGYSALRYPSTSDNDGGLLAVAAVSGLSPFTHSLFLHSISRGLLSALFHATGSNPVILFVGSE